MNNYRNVVSDIINDIVNTNGVGIPDSVRKYVNGINIHQDFDFLFKPAIECNNTSVISFLIKNGINPSYEVITTTSPIEHPEVITCFIDNFEFDQLYGLLYHANSTFNVDAVNKIILRLPSI